MAKTLDLRIQSTGRVDNYLAVLGQTGIISLYANASGIVCQVDSTGVNAQVGTIYTGIINGPGGNISTGQAQYNSGLWFADTSAKVLTGLANPSIWVNITYNGTNYAVPAYKYT